ncbi:alpha-galactosidase, partial [Lacticaseibacillus rhamnosus]
SPAQKSACKDLGRNGQSTAITSKAAYTPTSNRAGSRSLSVSIDIPLLIRYYKQGSTNTVLSVR